jgi:hypothetical protein
MSTVQLNALAIGGLIQTARSGNIQVPADGLITVDTRDAASLLAAGASYIRASTRQQNINLPIAGAVGQYVASVAFANGTATIANQPDVPRLASVRIDAGTSAITAGNVAVSYIAIDGTTQVDNLSAITAASSVASQNVTKGITKINSVVTTGLVGGASPKLQMDSLNQLGVLADPGYVDFSVLDLKVDGVDSGVASIATAAACFTPSTAPNGTHNYSVISAFNSPIT